MELILLLAIVLLLFGPGKLPEVGKSLGNAIREFRKATSDVQDATRVSTAAQQTAPPAQVQAAPTAQVQTAPPAQVQAAPTAQPVAEPQPVAQPQTAPAPQPAPAQSPAPNTLSGGVQVNTISEPGSEGTPRA